MSSCSKIERASGRSNLLAVAAIQRRAAVPPRFSHFLAAGAISIRHQTPQRRKTVRPTDRYRQPPERAPNSRPPVAVADGGVRRGGQRARAAFLSLSLSPCSPCSSPSFSVVSVSKRRVLRQSCSFLYVVKRCLSNAPERRSEIITTATAPFFEGTFSAVIWSKDDSE